MPVHTYVRLQLEFPLEQRNDLKTLYFRKYVTFRGLFFEICLHHFPNEIRVNMMFSMINFRNVHLLVKEFDYTTLLGAMVILDTPL